jgi:GT2 family glycosyltransferase
MKLMKLALVIATHRRADLLQKVLVNLVSRQRIPDEIIISAVDPADIPEIDGNTVNVRRVFGTPGLTSQRNRGISCVIDTADLISFLDDDFVVGDDYFRNVESIFARDPSIVGLTGEVVADGAIRRGFTFEQGLELLEQHSKRPRAPSITREIIGTYGCNMTFRTSCIGRLRFDERLALYGWQEDMDFSGALRSKGRIVKTNLIWGVHLGTKRGKGSELRLGYSQIVNPIYIVSKGNMSAAYAFQLVARNLVANLVKSVRPENYVDRRGRLRGNLIGVFHLMTGRLTPEYVLTME